MADLAVVPLGVASRSRAWAASWRGATTARSRRFVGGTAFGRQPGVARPHARRVGPSSDSRTVVARPSDAAVRGAARARHRRHRDRRRTPPAQGRQSVHLGAALVRDRPHPDRDCCAAMPAAASTRACRADRSSPCWCCSRLQRASSLLKHRRIAAATATALCSRSRMSAWRRHRPADRAADPTSGRYSRRGLFVRATRIIGTRSPTLGRVEKVGAARFRIRPALMGIHGQTMRSFAASGAPAKWFSVERRCTPAAAFRSRCRRYPDSGRFSVLWLDAAAMRGIRRARLLPPRRPPRLRVVASL